jgi:hypothetical protein
MLKPLFLSVTLALAILLWPGPAQAWISLSLCSGDCCVKGKTDIGHQCVRNFIARYWSESEQRVVKPYFIQHRLNERQKRRIEKRFDMEKGSMGRHGTAYGLADEDADEIVEPVYKNIAVLAEGLAIAERFDGKVVYVEFGSGEERPYPYQGYFSYYTPDLDMPKISMAYEKDNGNGFHTFVMLGPEGRELRRFERIRNWQDFNYHKGGLLFVPEYAPDSDITLTSVFDVRGTHLLTADIRFFVSRYVVNLYKANKDRFTEHPAVDIGPNPRPFGPGSSRLYLPLDNNTGLPLTVPDDIVGFVPFVQGEHLKRWIVVFNDNGELRYQVGNASVQETLASRETLPVFSAVAVVNYDRQSLAEGLPELNAPNKKTLERNSGFQFPGQLAVRLADSGRWVHVPAWNDRVFSARDYEFATGIQADSPAQAVNASYLGYHERTIARQDEKQRQYIEKQQRLAAANENARAYVKANMGKSLADPCDSPLYFKARLLGGRYLADFVRHYHYCSNDDVEEVCGADAGACATARAQRAANDQAIAREEAARAAFRNAVRNAHKNYGPETGDVRVLINDNGVMRQEKMSREHYNKYYNPVTR